MDETKIEVVKEEPIPLSQRVSMTLGCASEDALVKKYVATATWLQSTYPTASKPSIASVVMSLAFLRIKPMPPYVSFAVMGGELVAFPSARGIIKAAIESGVLKYVWASPLYSGDKVFTDDKDIDCSLESVAKYLLSSSKTPTIIRSDNGSLLGGVFKAILMNDEIRVSTLTAKELAAIKSFSKCATSSAWVKRESEMWIKSIIKWGLKYILDGQPCEEVNNLIELDNKAFYDVEPKSTDRAINKANDIVARYKTVEAKDETPVQEENEPTQGDSQDLPAIP